MSISIIYINCNSTNYNLKFQQRNIIVEKCLRMIIWTSIKKDLVRDLMLSRKEEKKRPEKLKLFLKRLKL